MNITELSVKRPTAIIMLVALFIGLGIFGYTNIGADLFPKANTPIIAIQTVYVGASAEEIEKDIVKPIEDAVSGISGIDTIRSTAGEGYEMTILQFTTKTSSETAVIDVQKALEGATDKLPKDADKPVMYKFDINERPILILSMSGASSYNELYKEADRIKASMENLDGVGKVTLHGAYKKELSITLDKTLLEHYGVDAGTVLAKLQAENMNIPAGQIKQEKQDKTVRVIGEFQDVNEVRDLRIPTAYGGMIRLGDIAAVDLKYPEADNIIRFDDKQSIGIYVQKQSDANVVATANLVKKELKGMQSTLPPNVHLTIASDATTFINGSLSETKRNLIEGIITTAIVLFLFLRKWRSSLIILVAIPTSLISTFFAMYVMNFTFNIVSLMALALCVGILVDDSIVVLENIHRHIQMGKDHKTAAIEGRMEIGMAAIAITLCDVVVFAPIGFLRDMVGQFFRQFGLTVVCATLFSLFISFTLTPMLASRMYKHEKQLPGSEDEKTGWFTQLFEKYAKPNYKRFLIWSLDNRWKIVSLVTLFLFISVMTIPLHLVGTEFIPKFDQSRLIVDISMTPGTNLAQTDAKVREVEKYIHSLPEVKEYLTSVGADRNTAAASISINLVERNKRKKGESQLASELRQWGKSLTGVSFSVSEPSIVDQTSIDGSKPIILNITGPNKDVLKQVSKQIEEIVKSTRGVVDVGNTIRASQPEIKVQVNRLASSQYQVPVASLVSTLRTAIAGTDAGVFRKDGDEYDIIVKFDPKQVNTPSAISSLKVRNQLGQEIALSQIAEVYQSDSPREVLRLDRQNVVTVSANMQGRALGEINRDIKDKLKTLDMPYGYKIEFGGDQSNMSTSFKSLILALIASILLIYMILVVLYESYLTPAIRMLSLPCGMIGALLALAITGKTLNIVTMIGLIMLDGLASKNGTLLIDYTNTLMKRGMPLREALIEAGETRLRPILMTSITMIFGMMPLALSLGEGSEIKSGMAIALVGGLITSTVFSPILLPVAYTLIDDVRHRRSKKNHRKDNANNMIITGGTEI